MDCGIFQHWVKLSMKPTLGTFFILSLIAGFADTATFIHLSGLFSSHVTGNFVLLAASLQKSTGGEEILKLLALPAFVLAVALATLIHDRLRRDEAEEVLDCRLAPAAGVLLLLGASLAFLYGRPGGAGPMTLADAAAGMITVVAMGVQNAIHRFAAPLGPPTTVMTGNVTQLTVLASRRLTRGPANAEKAPAPAFSLPGLAWLAFAFAAGCAISAVLTLAWGLSSLAVPGLLLITASLWHQL
jgi:uncharacterized membrane protein YoaK (UPF0700 family)